MEDKQQLFTERLNGFQPVAWDLIPDLGLYMDQVITFVERQCKDLFMEGDRIFTPSMVNNYVKIGLIDRPVAKKYSREQLAQLLMICILKQSISAEDMKALVQPPKDVPIREHYEAFCQTELGVFRALSASLPIPTLNCAVQGAAYMLLCRTLLHRPKTEPDKGSHSHHSHKDAPPKPDPDPAARAK